MSAPPQRYSKAKYKSFYGSKLAFNGPYSAVLLISDNLFLAFKGEAGWCQFIGSHCDGQECGSHSYQPRNGFAKPVKHQFRTQRPQAFWSAGRRLERPWAISYPESSGFLVSGTTPGVTLGNLVPRVLRLFGQRDDAWRDSG